MSILILISMTISMGLYYEITNMKYLLLITY